MAFTSSSTDRLRALGQASLVSSTARTATAADVVQDSQALAAALRHLGCAPGEVAVVLVGAGVDLLVVVHAAIQAGLMLALIDPEMGPGHFKAKLAQLEPSVVFADSRLLLLQEHPVAYVLLRRWRDVPYVPRFGRATLVSVGPWVPMMRRHHRLANLVRRGRRLQVTEPTAQRRTGECLITYTSGTLAEPKGVVHTLDGLDVSIRALASVIGDPVGQRIATHLPHYVLLGTCIGIPVFVWQREWDPSGKLQFMRQHGITTLFGPPADFVPLMRTLTQSGQRFPESVRLVMLGSAPVHPGFLERLKECLLPHVRVLCLYGMTEHLLVATATMAEKLASGVEGDYIGRPVDGVDVRIEDDGELLVRSGQGFSRYLNDRDGSEWHATGDLARRAPDGSITLLGRKKDMIIRGNFNLYPSLYEATVSRIPGVEAAAFVGVYDEAAADERVYLVVEPLPACTDHDALGRRLAALLRDGEFAIDREAWPDTILVRDLPRSGRSRKVDKARLREHLGDPS